MIEFTFGRLCELLNADFHFLPFPNLTSAETGSKSDTNRHPGLSGPAGVKMGQNCHDLDPDLFN